MKVISDVKDVEVTAKGIISRIKDIVLKLKKHNVPLMQEKEKKTLSKPMIMCSLLSKKLALE